MKPIHIITLALMCYPVLSIAGNEGGGGDVRVCYDHDGKTILDMESYDMFVARSEYRLDTGRPELGTNKPGDDTIPYLDQTMAIFDRLAQIDLRASELFKKEAALFAEDHIMDPSQDDVRIVPGLIDNGDSGERHIQESSKHCPIIRRERMAWLNDDPKPHQARYELTERLWKAAPNSVKAAVIRHEVIWRTERELFYSNEVRTSRDTQYYNGVISSKQFNNYNWNDYRNILRAQENNGGPNWLDRPFSVMINDIVFNTKRAFEYPCGSFGGDSLDSLPLSIYGVPFDSVAGELVEFHCDLTLKRATPRSSVRITVGQMPMTLKARSPFTMDDKGQLRYAEVTEGEIQLPESLGGGWFTLPAQYVNFTNNQITSFYVGFQNALELNIEGNRIYATNRVELDPELRPLKFRAWFCDRRRSVTLLGKKYRNIYGYYDLHFDYKSNLVTFQKRDECRDLVSKDKIEFMRPH